MKIVVFVSGNGSNLQAIIDAQKNGILPIKIVHVMCNQLNAYSIKRCEIENIPFTIFPRIISGAKITRKEYDQMLLRRLNVEMKKQNQTYDLIVLAGWMHILSDLFLNKLTCPIINLHPALPGAFPGAHAIEEAFSAYLNGEISHTGIMIHTVVPEIDSGNVIECTDIPIFEGDSLDTLRNRISFFEKGLLLKAIGDLAQSPQLLTESFEIRPEKIHSGKVRDIYDIGYNLISMVATDKQSAFDRHICNIPGKGVILNQISAMWMKLTSHIIPNHLVSCDEKSTMICKKAKRIDIEVVVRGYIAGTTSTSLWTHYDNGERKYCGISFPDGLKKNQRLPEPIVTPTTKGVKDDPISSQEIVEREIVTLGEWQYIKFKALELYAFGAEYSSHRGLILVDTKYEFGRDIDGNIILIDELHTCDSSRYWIKHTYDESFKNGEDPESLDKDVIRRFIREKCDPYNDPLPEISDDLVCKAKDAYLKFQKMISSDADPQKVIDDFIIEHQLIIK